MSEAAQGNGQILAGLSTSASTNGLQVRVTLGASRVAANPTATVTVTRGLASRLGQVLSSFVNPINGRLKRIDQSFQDSVDSIQHTIDSQKTSLAARQLALQLEFTNMETTIAQVAEHRQLPDPAVQQSEEYFFLVEVRFPLPISTRAPRSENDRPMNPYARYSQQSAPTQTRIDSLLALFDAACERTEAAAVALAGPDAELARALRARARLVVLGLWSGVDIERGAGAGDIVSLYQFAATALATGTVDDVRGAADVLRILREGFRGIREEGVQLERLGIIPSVDAICAIHAVG